MSINLMVFVVCVSNVNDDCVSYPHHSRKFICLIDMTSSFWSQQELTKFINHCNEIKAATVACKDGGQLSVVKAPSQPSNDAKK